jgi:hypothetical protein
MNKKIESTIKGISPLLMHKFPMIAIEGLEKKAPEEQAEAHVYRDPDTQELFVPAVNVQRALVAGAAYSKGKRGSSLAKSAAACLQVGPERLGLGTKKFTIDSRPVVIAATKGRIVRHRARFEVWELTFELEYDDLLLKPVEVRRIVDDTGVRVGLMDYRPEKKGPFGRFQVISWEE